MRVNSNAEHANKNYEIKVRASYQDGSYSDFSETLIFNSGQIQNVVTGVFPNKYVIDGLGVSGYIPKFSDSDSLTTGTLYYSGSNNLVFTELPTTTTSENLYKLVKIFPFKFSPIIDLTIINKI